MISLVLFAQISLAAGAPAVDSVYSSPALRDFVAGAAVANHAPPPELSGYRARVETEFSVLLRDTLGRERSGQIEQLASTVHWTRGGTYEMHVVGYRSEGIGSPMSLLSFVEGWTEPTLFGERLMLGVQIAGDEARRTAQSRVPRRDTIIAVHPFSADRADFYRFSGGDTAVIMRSGGRTIPIVRIHVTPHLHGATHLAAFDGEIDLDADRRQIVRMRGQFVILGRARRNRVSLARVPGLVGVAYCEFINAEIGGRYWLPVFQRTELQSTFFLLGNTRAVIRAVSRFSDYLVDDTTGVVAAGGDSIRTPHNTTWAPSDSVSHFGSWKSALGDETGAVTADDFDDVAPDVWKSTGRPRLDLVPTKTDNIVRYDRVEGLYTGIEANVRMRSAYPGLSFGALAGYAWAERTFRGGAHAVLSRTPWIAGVRAERVLATTNDFLRPLEPESGGLAAVIGSYDDFDYVDRRAALVSVSHVAGSLERGLVTLQLGVADDRAERARLAHGLIGGGRFRPNRGVDAGGYSLGVVEAELHPNVSGESAQPGFGAKVHYEIAGGSLDWQRDELSLWERKYWGPLALSVDAEGGAVWGSVIPPQTLFELGGTNALPGYDYKEFAGDRAFLLRSDAYYTFPLWRSPHRVWRTLFIPGLAPGIATSLQGGWTDISNNAAALAILKLGAERSATPVSRATNGFRATFGFGVTLLSGAAHLGLARPVDHPAPWKFSGGLGRAF